jgi:membrane-bound lytic murein transglycosylase D
LTTACASGVRPTSAPASRPASATTTPSGRNAAPASASRADAVVLLLLPDSARGANIDAKLREAIVSTSALFEVPDSTAAREQMTFIDVDSTSMSDDVDSWDMDVRSYLTQDKVARYVDLFLGSSRERFVVRLQRGKQYEGMIRAKLRAKGIPEDMYFLALVESGYDPHAYSKAAAVGMWQFMTTTARAVGLRVDWWVDERRDPVKSTDGAARFISDLRDQFGSLYLAAAAYNGGPGRVSRGLAKYSDDLQDVEGEDVFFALAEQDYLRAETKNYVPQLIAAAIVGKNPARYGITLDSLASFAYDSVLVPAGTPVGAVAKSIGADVRELQALNPHILRGLTPPDGKSYVRVPVGMASSFEKQFATLTDEERIPFEVVVTRKNESLASIARRYDISERQLTWYNRKISYVRRGKLTAGQKLLVPSPVVLAAAFDVPDPAVERYGSSRSASGRVVHVVKRGESLGTIARKYRTSSATLIRLNRLKKPIIYPGQSIIVRGSAKASPSRSRAASKSAKRPVTKPTSSGSATSSTSQQKAAALSKSAAAVKPR